MDDLNELSNEELQYRLAQFGSPTLPVTSTTRKVLLKRLRNLIENEKLKLRRDTDYATRYSSDEDVDGLKASKSIKSRGRSTLTTKSINSNASALRKRSNLNMPPPSNSSSTTATSSLSLSQKPASLWNDNNVSLKKSSTGQIYISPLIQHDTDEDSDQTDGLNSSFSSNRYRNSIHQAISISSANSRTTPIYNGHDVPNNSIGKARYSSSNDSSGEKSSQYNNLLNASTESSTNGDHENDDLSSPYTSTNFTKRLLSLRNRSLGSAINAPPLIDTSKLHRILFKFFIRKLFS